MTLRIRRIIYLTFIGIFLIITPLLALYAAGYRYNFKKNKLQKPGILILKSEPTGATIYLNNKIQKEETPAKITNLFPNDYLVKVEKENFYPWQKKLNVKSKLTTFAENIILFKKSLPTEVKINNIELMALAPDNQKIVYVASEKTGQEVWLLTLKDEKEKLIYRTSSKNKINSIEWGPQSKKILITVLNSQKIEGYFVLNTENLEEINIYEKLEDFYFEFKNIEDKWSLDSYTLIEGQNEFITLLDRENQSLTILEPQSNEIIFKTEALGASWSQDGQKLLYFNTFELWIYDLAFDQKNLISRYSQEISETKWHLSENYIFLLLDNSIKAIELDSRDVRNVTDLVRVDRIDKFEINKKEDKLYLLGKIGTKTGIYELGI